MNASVSHRQPAAGMPPPPAPDQLTLSAVITAGGAGSGLLRRSVDSLLTEAPDGLELIIVTGDDSGTDTRALADRLAAENSRVRVIHQAGTLTAAARNAGLAAAAGDYVGYIDASDEAGPGWARALLSAAAQLHPAMVRGGVQLLHGGSGSTPGPACTSMAPRAPLHGTDCMVVAAICRRDFVQARQLCFAAGGPDAIRDFQVRSEVAALLEHERIALCPQACWRHHREHGGSVITGRDEADAGLRIYAALHELFLQHHARLPPSGVGVQYYAWITRLFHLARSAAHPDDGAAAAALAQRLNCECPQPGALEQVMEAVRRAPPPAPQPPA